MTAVPSLVVLAVPGAAFVPVTDALASARAALGPAVRPAPLS